MKARSGSSHPLMLWGRDFDPDTLRQLSALADMPYIFHHVAAMPDAHVGIGATIGSVFATTDAAVPSAVGVDIGCGMRAVSTDLPAAAATRERLQRFIDLVYARIPLGFESHGSERTWPGMKSFPLDDGALRKKAAMQLGTLGGGNHFLEAQSDSEHLWLMIHSGSRHIGLQIAEHFIREARAYNTLKKLGIPQDLSFLPVHEQGGRDYLEAMNWALDYARENRRQLLEQLLDLFRLAVTPGFRVIEDIEIHHNFAAFETHFNRKVLVHRKGATRAFENEAGIIPGSMGSSSFITRGRGNAFSFMSSSHGAGRALSRKAAQKKIAMDEFQRSMSGVVANLKRSMLDEAPQAYKDINAVMEAQADLVEIIHRLTPLASVKG